MTNEEIANTYRNAGVALYDVLRRRDDVLQFIQSAFANEETTAAWARLFDEWVANYREARRLWNARLSDGSPSWASRLAAARLLKRTATHARDNLAALERRARSVPALVRWIDALGLRGHVEALGAVSEGAASVARGVAAGAVGVLVLGALLLAGVLSK